MQMQSLSSCISPAAYATLNREECTVQILPDVTAECSVCLQALTAHMDGTSQAALQGMMQHAEEVRSKPAREE